MLNFLKLIYEGFSANFKLSLTRPVRTQQDKVNPYAFFGA